MKTRYPAGLCGCSKSLCYRPLCCRRHGGELLRMANPVVVLDASAEVLELGVDPGGLIIAPFRDLPEIVDADPVQQFVQVRTDAVDLLKIVRRAEGRLDKE